MAGKRIQFNRLLPKRPGQGFTLMEIVVSTTIFAVTVTLMLSLFNYTLKINRRVQSLRQISQGTRNFTEVLAREIRNGQIDYSSVLPGCTNNYGSATNSSLGLITKDGDRQCFSISGTDLVLNKSVSGNTFTENVNPTNFRVKSGSMHFIVRPTTDPYAAVYPGIQPFVTITAVFEVQLSPNDPIISIPYQTTISTDVYDVPHR